MKNAEYKYQLVRYNTDDAIRNAVVRHTVAGAKPTLLAVWIDIPIRVARLRLEEKNYMTVGWPTEWDEKLKGAAICKDMLDVGSRLGISAQAKEFLETAREAFIGGSH